MSDEELEQLKQETQMTDRAHEDEVTFNAETFVDVLVEELDKIEDGASKTYSARDENGMALLQALDRHPDGRDVLVAGLEDELDVDVDGADRSEVVRLLLRAGLASAAPELLDLLEQAVGRHASSSV